MLVLVLIRQPKRRHLLGRLRRWIRRGLMRRRGLPRAERTILRSRAVRATWRFERREVTVVLNRRCHCAIGVIGRRAGRRRCSGHRRRIAGVGSAVVCGSVVRICLCARRGGRQRSGALHACARRRRRGVRRGRIGAMVRGVAGRVPRGVVFVSHDAPFLEMFIHVYRSLPPIVTAQSLQLRRWLKHCLLVKTSVLEVS